MKSNVLTALDAVPFDPKSQANLNYVKARCVIEEKATCRSDRREAKLAVVTLLNGVVSHPNPAEAKRGVTKQVTFPDGSKARF